MIQMHQSGPKQPNVHVLDDFAGQGAQMIADAILTTVRHNGRCRIGLAGGTTPGSIYAKLRELLPISVYPQLWVTWTDERVLEKVGEKPGDWQPFDPDSNLRLAYSEWLGHVPLPPENVLPMSLSGDAKAELLRFGKAFQDQFDGALDIALLGVGADGHVASLFPGHPALEVDDLALAVHDSPKPPSARISLTIPTLMRSGTLILLARGKGKAHVVRRALAADADLPVSRLLDHPRTYWLLDGPAAQEVVTAALESMTPGD
jgi:6-phosphogluconolactonase